MSTVFLASRNAKKLAEMQRILAEHVPGIEVVGLDDVPAYDEPVEDQPTFEGNALLKARAALAATGLPSLADDSGLCVDALNGMPGVLSARWSGPPEERRAQQPAAAGPARRRARRAARRPLRLRGGVLPPRRHRAGRPRPDGRPGDPRAPRGTAASATTCSSSPTSTRRGPHLGRAARRREGRDLAPGPGPARDRARCRRRPQGTVTTTLPRTWPSSESRCASARSSSAKVRSTSTRSLPSSASSRERVEPVAVRADEHVAPAHGRARSARRRSRPPGRCPWSASGRPRARRRRRGRARRRRGTRAAR